MERPSGSDLGLRVVNEIYDLMGIDAQWSVWEPRGFTWWGWHSAQRVWSELGVDDHGFRLYRLYAAAELFDGFENTDEQVLLLNDLTTHMTLSGMVAPKRRPGRIELAASVYVHEEIVDWARVLFGTAVAMQAAEAAILAGQLPSTENVGLRPVTSAHPQSGPRTEMDDMLNIFNRVNAEGQSPSRYAGEEMEQLVATLQQPPCVLATGGKMGVTAEFPYPRPVGTSLLQLRTTDQDPRAGNGLFALLTIPEGKNDAATARQALETNRLELNSVTWTHFLGCWCTSERGLTYIAFYPNYLHRIGCLQNIAMATVARVRWLTEEVMDYSWHEHFQEAFERKLAVLKQVSERPTTAAEKRNLSNVCPYCQQDLNESVCEHWVASLSDDSDGYDTLTPLYFGWTEHMSESQEKMVASLDGYFKALCTLCERVAKRGPDEGKKILRDAKKLSPVQKATLTEAIKLLDQPDVKQNYENTHDLLRGEFARPMKDLFTDFFQRCGEKVSKTDWTIDHSPGLSWSGTNYCAEDAKQCVMFIIQECEKATDRISKLVHTR